MASTDTTLGVIDIRDMNRPISALATVSRPNTDDQRPGADLRGQHRDGHRAHDVADRVTGLDHPDPADRDVQVFTTDGVSSTANVRVRPRRRRPIPLGGLCGHPDRADQHDRHREPVCCTDFARTCSSAGSAMAGSASITVSALPSVETLCVTVSARNCAGNWTRVLTRRCRARSGRRVSRCSHWPDRCPGCRCAAPPAATMVVCGLLDARMCIDIEVTAHRSR